MEAPGRVRGMRRPHEPRGQPHFVLPPNLYMGPPVGGLFGFKFSSRPHPRKSDVKRFLVVREVARAVSGVACFGLPPWKKFSAARSRSSHSAQEDGCSSLPCRGVLSFRSGAREASGSETPQVHNVARWCRGVAARGARTRLSCPADRLSKQRLARPVHAARGCIPPGPARRRLCRRPERHDRVSLGGRSICTAAGPGSRAGAPPGVLIVAAGGTV